MKFLVHSRQLMDKSQAMLNEHSQMITTLANLDGQVNTLTASWEGLASDNFILKYRELKPNVEAVLNIAKKYGDNLHKIASNYTGTETTVAGEKGSLPTVL